MAEQKVGHAHIRINPQELGPSRSACAWTASASTPTSAAPGRMRQALENSLPKLRDMLAQHGFALAQANVGQHASRTAGPQDPQPPIAAPLHQTAAAADAAGGQPAQMVRSVRVCWMLMLRREA
jgi:flagellar hook-length control protein FliK